MTEQWRTIPRYPAYQASSLGRIRREGRIRKPKLMRHGYLSLQLKQGVQEYVATLILETFCGSRPTSFVSCHGNGIKTDNRAVNLRWDTRSNNETDKKAHGTDNAGSRNGNAKLTEESVCEILSLYKEGHGPAELSRRFNVSDTTVSAVIHRKRWMHVPRMVAA